MKKIISYLTILLVLLLPFACVEDNFEEFIADETEELPSTLEDFEKVLAALQDSVFNDVSGVCNVQNNEGGTFRTKYGSIITISEDAFDINGCNSCSNDFEIEVTYIELHTIEELIRFYKPTVSNGFPLVSGGVIKFEAKVGDEIVYLRDGVSINVKFPINDDTQFQNSMELFEGELIANPSTVEDSIYNWEPIPQENPEFGDVAITELDSLSDILFYDFNVDSYEWINCDAFYNFPDNQLTDIKLVLPEAFSYTNTIVYLYFTEENTVMQLYYDNDSFTAKNIPIGYKAKIVGISTTKDDNDNPVYWLSKIDEFSIESGLSLTTDPEEVTEEELEKFIKSI